MPAKLEMLQQAARQHQWATAAESAAEAPADEAAGGERRHQAQVAIGAAPAVAPRLSRPALGHSTKSAQPQGGGWSGNRMWSLHSIDPRDLLASLVLSLLRSARTRP
eukprot:CAMPEP_0204191136 /NCGR_PEP_ID=MMETSP0361-20130328/59859_1 /ASSEMBLY_ACC=CAM_ASM_000343 /TAXON_ID=268821 /ORGANISM="Scrippsiella Hangoei, Strain SHTV-5" /LENGTH=106 /DNA_ID=CAMNT_0051152051 /DNA_START=131 /DNA_END=449 /DNA_ORIENTATION=-